MSTLPGIFNFDSGFSIGIILVGLIWAYRAIKAYCVETREEYISRLNEVSLELEKEKTKVLELELRLRFFAAFAKHYEQQEKDKE